MDFTIADWVADVRAPTPSAAAEMVSPDWQHLLNYTQEAKQRLTHAMKNQLQYYQDQLKILQQQLKHPKAYWEQLSQWVDYQELHLNELVQQKLQDQQQALRLAANSLNNLNPLTILNRGYAIALDDNKRVLSSVKQFSPEQSFDLQLQDGVVKART